MRNCSILYFFFFIESVFLANCLGASKSHQKPQVLAFDPFDRGNGVSSLFTLGLPPLLFRVQIFISLLLSK